MKTNKLFFALIFTVGAFCFHTSNIEARSHKTTGEKVDSSIDYTKDKLKDAKDKAKDAKDKVKEKAKDTKDKIKEKTSEGIDKVKDGLDKVKPNN